MRVLMSIHQYLDRKTGTGGVTWQLAEALRRRGHEVDILSFECVSASERVKTYFYPWFVASFIAKHPRYDVLDLSSRDGWLLSAGRRLLGRKSLPVVIARSHGLEHLLHEARVSASKQGTMQLSWRYALYKGSLRLWECRTSLLLADAALFLNFEERDYAIKHLGLDPRRAVRLKNGIADSFVSRARSLLAITVSNESPKNVAFIGRYSDLKGAPYLRAAMQGILTKYPDTRFGLLGTMVDRDAVVDDFQPELRRRMDVIPRYQNDQLPELLAGYHVLAFPSLFEGFALAPLEAMACGLVPVVAKTPGPASYIKSGYNGLLVPPRDPHELEHEIAGLLDNSDRWRAMRSNALATALDYSWDRVAAEVEHVYARCIMLQSERRAV